MKAKLLTLRGILEGKTVGRPHFLRPENDRAYWIECAYCKNYWAQDKTPPNTELCSIPDRIPDPAYAALLVVIRVECDLIHHLMPPDGHEFSHRRGGPCQHLEMSCSAVGCTGYSLRSWGGMPVGALWGAFEFAMETAPKEIRLAHFHAKFDRRLVTGRKADEKTNETALDAVIAAVR